MVETAASTEGIMVEAEGLDRALTVVDLVVVMSVMAVVVVIMGVVMVGGGGGGCSRGVEEG